LNLQLAPLTIQNSPKDFLLSQLRTRPTSECRRSMRLLSKSQKLKRV